MTVGYLDHSWPRRRCGCFETEERRNPEVVVRTLAGGHFVVGLGLNGVNKIGELHGVLYEEHRNVVPG